MRCVLQRVKRANLLVDNNLVGEIGEGLVIFLGVGKEDKEEDLKYLCDKIVKLRIFSDKQDKMNLSCLDLKKEILVVSQFTLYADCKKGNRPDFTEAAKPDYAEELYEKFILYLKEYNLEVKKGLFGARMVVEVINDGPVTIILDSKMR